MSLCPSHAEQQRKQVEDQAAKFVAEASSICASPRTATPSEVDHALSVLGAAADQFLRYAMGEQQYRDKPYNAHRLVEIDARIESYKDVIERLNKACEPLRDEFNRRSWSRYSIVHRGHFHYMPTLCGSLRYTFWGRTQTFLAWEHSGKTAEALVKDTQEVACTRCFPWAPVKPKVVDPLRCPGSGQANFTADSKSYSSYGFCAFCNGRVKKTKYGAARAHRRPK